MRMHELMRADTERLLEVWRLNNERRDYLVTLAHQNGTSKNRIHVLTGIARTTIDRILDPRKET